MHAVGVELEVGGRALGGAQIAGDRQAWTQWQHVGQRGAARGVAPLCRRTKFRRGRVGVAVRTHDDAFQAQACRRGAALPGQLFEQEHAGLARVGARHEGLFAQRREVEALALHADDATQRPQGRVLGLQSQLLAPAGKAGADGAAAFDFLVHVVAQVGVDAQRADGATRGRPLGRQAEVVAFHADRDVGLGHDAIGAVVGIRRQADAAVGKEQRAAQCTAARAGRRVAHAACGIERQAVLQRHVFGRAQVSGVPAKSVGVPGEGKVAALAAAASAPAVDHQRAAALAIGTAQAQLGGARDARGALARDAVVQRVDHAAHRAAAVEQRGRAAQHLDAVDDQRIDRHRVVVAQ